MRRYAAALLLAGACSKAPPSVAPLPSPCGAAQSFPAKGTFVFAAQTRADSAIEGRLEGTASIENGWINVSVPRAMLTVPPGRSENWRNITIRPFMATEFCTGSWKAVAQSRPVNVFRFINFGNLNQWEARRTVAVEEPLKFLVPIPPGASLSTSRLAFEIEWVTVFGTFGDTESRFAFSGPIQFGRPSP